MLWMRAARISTDISCERHLASPTTHHTVLPGIKYGAKNAKEFTSREEGHCLS
jgi:hypothetical protein